MVSLTTSVVEDVVSSSRIFHMQSDKKYKITTNKVIDIYYV